MQSFRFFSSSFLLYFLVTFITPISARNLFFGKTHDGKTTLINKCCDLSQKVAEPDQTESTTSNITVHDCLGTSVVDTVGIFDFREDNSLNLTTKTIIKLILDTASTGGLSSLIWVWASKNTVRDKELEEVFDTLRIILPEVPSVVVNNRFPSLNSGVPAALNKHFGLKVIETSLSDVSQLKQWILDHKRVFQITLPPNVDELIAKHGAQEELRKALLESSLLACNTVRKQLDAITDQLKNVPPPKQECGCARDCLITETYCCSKLVFCLSKCTKSRPDGECMRQVEKCYEDCSRRFGEAVAQTGKLLDNLNNSFKQITATNENLLQTCDKFNLSGKLKHEL